MNSDPLRTTIVLVFTLLSCIMGIMGRSESVSSSSAAHHFKLVYGEERVNLHFLTNEDLDEAVHVVNDMHRDKGKFAQNAPDSRYDLDGDEMRVYSPTELLCSLYSSGPLVAKTLGKVFGKESVNTVYSSYNNNRVCFITHSDKWESGSTFIDDSSTLTEFAEAGIIFWSRVPHPLKLHPSTFFYLNLLEEHPNKDFLHDTTTLKNPFSDDFSISRAKLELGIVKPQNVNLTWLAEQIEHKLKHSTSIESFRPMLHMYSSGDYVWSKAHAKLSPQQSSTFERSPQCSFQNLTISPCHFGVEIHGLDFLNENFHATPCTLLLLSYLAKERDVIDIRVKHEKFLFNNYIKSIVQSEVYAQGENYYPYTTSGLDGEGQVVGIGDSGLDELSCFFNNGDDTLMERSSHEAPVTNVTRRKVVQYISFKDGKDTRGGHGTHVSGTVAGSVQESDGTIQQNISTSDMDVYGGHAPKSKVAFFDMSDDGNSILYPSPLGENVFRPAFDAGARIHTNSWGGPFNFYDSDTVSVDKFLVENDEFLALFAAGNDGSDGYYSVADPGVSKNALTVGASLSNTTMERMAFFSSMGPTFDGRIKPDVVAPGYFTYSACAGSEGNVTCSIERHAGTSMATPAVAGAAALIRQYFEGNKERSGTTPYQRVCRKAYPMCSGSFSPRGATVKAMLIHSGERMEEYYVGRFNTTEPTSLLGSPPDMYQGFGRISLPNVLPFENIEEVVDLYIEELEIASLRKISYEVVVFDSSKPLKATIVWMDPVNHIIQSKLLLHDIDLQIISPSGDTYYGNKEPGDEVNNVEQVTINSPDINSTYFVHIVSKVFTEKDDQKLSLVITSGAGIVQKKADVPVSLSKAYNPLSCTGTEQMVKIKKMDRGGDGWSDGYYSLRKIDLQGTGSDDGSVLTGTMSNVASIDVVDFDYYCLPFGIYNISLHPPPNDSTQLQEMGLAVHQCGVYLSEYQPSAVLSFISRDICNPCDHNESFSETTSSNHSDSYFGVQLVLVGSIYGVPYGWKGLSRYTIRNDFGNIISQGTLLVGMLEERRLCLQYAYTYDLVLEDVPADDDFFDDDWMSTHLGTNEYQIGVLGCNNSKYISKHSYHAHHDEKVTVVGATENLVLARAGNIIHIDLRTEGRCDAYTDGSSFSMLTTFPWYLDFLAALMLSVIVSGLVILFLNWKGVKPYHGHVALDHDGDSSVGDSGHASNEDDDHFHTAATSRESEKSQMSPFNVYR